MFFMIGLPSAFALPAAAPADGVDCPIEMVRREMSNDKGQKKTLLVRDSFVPTARSKRGDVERRDVNFPSPGPVAFNGDQCGTSTFENTDDDSATGCNIDDCNALASGLRGLDQHWELTNGFGGAVKDWLLLAPAGTCQFYIDRSDFFDATTDGKNFVGTSDVADLVADSTANFQKWGTVTYPGGSFKLGLYRLSRATGDVSRPLGTHHGEFNQISRSFVSRYGIRNDPTGCEREALLVMLEVAEI